MHSIDDLGDGAQLGRSAAATVPAHKGRSVAFGYGSGADDTASGRLDLNDALIRNPQSTFVMRVGGDAMRDAGIDAGDVLVIDRAIPPAHGHVIVAIVDGELLCRRLERRGKDVRLIAANAADAAIADVASASAHSIELWGVVTTIIKRLVV
jgi:DNA polymerase V